MASPIADVSQQCFLQSLKMQVINFSNTRSKIRGGVLLIGSSMESINCSRVICKIRTICRQWD